MPFRYAIGSTSYRFDSLRELMAKASPERSGDRLAGIAASGHEERVAAQCALADVPLARFLSEAVVPYEVDDVTRLILDGHDRAAFGPLAAMTVGDLREWLLASEDAPAEFAASTAGLTPEMVAAVSKIMGNQDLILAARKVEVVTRFRSTLGLRGRLATRIQPNHPVDDLAGVLVSTIDGLMYGAGDAVIGINPATDDPAQLERLWRMLDTLITTYEIPTQACVLTHVTRHVEAMARGVPIDLVFQSIGGTEAVNRSFGFSLDLLAEARAAALATRRSGESDTVMYFETGQGSALSANGHHGVDQQTLEARAYGVARRFRPFLVNSVVGFIGPEYLKDGKQIRRAGLEDHFCGKMLGLPMGVDICYTNHCDADQDDSDDLLLLLGAAGVNFIMGVPGADDVLLGYQSTSYHDAVFVREVLGKRHAPEFEAWLRREGIVDGNGRLASAEGCRLPGAVGLLAA